MFLFVLFLIMWSQYEMKMHPIFQSHVIDLIVNNSYFILNLIFIQNFMNSLAIRLNC